MTLKAQYDRAYSAWKATGSHRWKAEVDRLNFKLMRRSRPARTAATVAAKKRGQTEPPHSMFIR